MNVSSASATNLDERFDFGENWREFLAVLDDERIAEAERSLETMLGVGALVGRTFLDVGSGSGLFSLAAARLGATRIHSLDYDPQSVETTRELKRRFFPKADHWSVERADALDGEHLTSLGKWDVVYSWGVLHHTGRLWKAMENVLPLVAPSGMLFVAIYNYQGLWTQWNTAMKRAYVRSPQAGRLLMLCAYVTLEVARGALKDVALMRNPLSRYRARKRARGMSVFHDWIDWIGGYPFEAAKPEDVFDFCRDRGFTLRRLKTCGGGQGCNEFVFVRS